MKPKIGICKSHKQEASLYAKGLCHSCYWREMRAKSKPIERKPIERKRTNPIRVISKKRATQMAEYRRLRDEFMKSNPICQARISIVCTHIATDLHHKAPRAFNLCNVNIFMAVCRNCHNHIHSNSDWAYENGFLLTKHLDYYDK